MLFADKVARARELIADDDERWLEFCFERGLIPDNVAHMPTYWRLFADELPVPAHDDH